MNIEVYTAKEVIEFCFLEPSEIDKLILEAKEEIVESNRKIMNGITIYSENVSRQNFKRLEILELCKLEHDKFIQIMHYGKYKSPFK